jgi:hypothetical protein
MKARRLVLGEHCLGCTAYLNDRSQPDPKPRKKKRRGVSGKKNTWQPGPKQNPATAGPSWFRALFRFLDGRGYFAVYEAADGDAAIYSATDGGLKGFYRQATRRLHVNDARLPVRDWAELPGLLARSRGVLT